MTQAQNGQTMNDTKFNTADWATNVAAALGDGWSARPSEHDWRDQSSRAYFDGPNGMTLFAIAGGWRNEGRITVSWDITRELTEHSRYNESARKEITVSQDKTAKRAAGDITRRLLPGLVELLTELRERKAKSDDADARRDTFLAQMAEILGGQVRGGGLRNDRPDVSFGESYSNGGTVEAYSGDTAEIKVRLPREHALAVAKVIAEFVR